MKNDQRQMTNELSERNARFSDGDRVRMVRHADWKQDATGTIAGHGRIRKGAFALYIDCFVAFDTPQLDFTDESNGESIGSYSGSTVAEEFLQQLPPETTT